MSEPFVVANLFHVEPADQGRLVSLLGRAAQRVRSARGFLGAELHRGHDGCKVMVLARWRSREDYETMRAAPASSSSLDEIGRIARFDPGFYEIVETFAPE